MKRKTINIILTLLTAVLLFSCYGLNDENLSHLASMDISYPSDIINAQLGVKLDYKELNIQSERNLPLSIEWAYGLTATNSTATYPIQEKLQVISNELNINYTFTKIGSYTLRLKVDNGESIIYKFFHLNVNSGLDEGIIVLTQDDNSNGKLSFIRTITTEEDDQQQWFFEDIISAINPGLNVQNPNDIYIANKNSSGKYPALILSTSDEEGSIFKMDPRTFELQKIIRVSESYPNVKCLQFAGFSTSGGRYTLTNGTDGAIYRYDFLTDDIALRTDTRNLGVKKAYHAQYDNSFNHFFYNDHTVYAPGYATVDSTWAASDLSNYQIINMVYKRSGVRELHVITRRLSDSHIVSHKMTSSFGSYAKRLDYAENDPIAMDDNSIMITTLYSSFCYYNFQNKVYRWNYNSELPTTQSSPTITPPLGEEITALGRSADDKYLYIGTYNRNRSGKKGSLYIYDFTTESLYKSYEGYFDKPLKILYKYRM